MLECFLRGSDSLWGMVDWERGSCDFTLPLFGKLLEAAGRWGDDGRKNAASGIMKVRSYGSFVGFGGPAEQEKEGRVVSGVLFDDGRYAVSGSSYTVAINANSAHKEGAWEFIRFLIGEESQEDLSYSSNQFEPPVHRAVFADWMQRNIDRAVNFNVVTKSTYYPPLNPDVSEEKQTAYLKALEEARPLPVRIVPILEVIRQEAESYFEGSKSAEEAGRVITNRVKLYLDERK